MKVTKKQIIILAAITEFINEQGYPPTVRQLGDKTGNASSSTVHRHLCNLKEMGYLEWESDKTRTMKILKSW